MWCDQRCKLKTTYNPELENERVFYLPLWSAVRATRWTNEFYILNNRLAASAWRWNGSSNWLIILFCNICYAFVVLQICFWHMCLTTAIRHFFSLNINKTLSYSACTIVCYSPGLKHDLRMQSVNWKLLAKLRAQRGQTDKPKNFFFLVLWIIEQEVKAN